MRLILSLVTSCLLRFNEGAVVLLELFRFGFGRGFVKGVSISGSPDSSPSNLVMTKLSLNISFDSCLDFFSLLEFGIKIFLLEICPLSSNSLIRIVLFELLTCFDTLSRSRF